MPGRGTVVPVGQEVYFLTEGRAQRRVKAGQTRQANAVLGLHCMNNIRNHLDQSLGCHWARVLRWQPKQTRSLAYFAYSRGCCCAGDNDNDNDDSGGDDVYSLSLTEFCYMYVFFGGPRRLLLFLLFNLVFSPTRAHSIAASSADGLLSTVFIFALFWLFWMYKKFGSDRATAPPFSRMRVQNDSKRARGIDVDKSTRQNATLKKLQRLPPGVATGGGCCQPKNSSVEQKIAFC